MALKENMPGTKGYVSTAGNLRNMASILNNRKVANQKDQMLALQQEELDFQRGAPERAVQAEQAVFDLTRQRKRQANQQRNAIVSNVTDTTYVPDESVSKLFATPEGGFGPQQPRADGTDAGFSAQEEDLNEFVDMMNANPHLFQNPKQISASIAKSARESNDYSEAEIASMQAQGLERFTTLKPEAQEQLYSEQKTILDATGKLLSDGRGSGRGVGGQDIAAVRTGETAAFEKDLYANGEFDDYKGGVGDFIDSWVFNIIDSPDAARNEIDELTGMMTASTGVPKLYQIKALLSLGMLRRDGNWDTEVGDIMESPEMKAKIEMRAREHEAAANKKSGASQAVRTRTLTDAISNFNSSNNDIRADSIPTQNTQANINQLARIFLQERAGPQSQLSVPGDVSSGDSSLIDTSDSDPDGTDGTLTADELSVEAPTQQVERARGRYPQSSYQYTDDAIIQKAVSKASAGSMSLGRGGKTKARVKATVPSDVTRLFDRLTTSGKAAALQEAESRLQQTNLSKKERKQLIDILSLAS